jgi:hypothetical protein
MESYLRAGQRWLSESDVAAKLDFCSMLGIHVKTPPKEGCVICAPPLPISSASHRLCRCRWCCCRGGKLLEGVLIPFAFLKPLFDRLEDSEVTQRLAHLQPAVIGKDLNQRRELAIMYAIARHMTDTHTHTQRRALLFADHTA